MAEFRDRNPKRTIIPYQDVLDLASEYNVICVSVGALMVVRALVRDRGFWQSTYYKSLQPYGTYEIPSVAEMDPIEAIISEFLEEANLSTCNDLTQILQELTAQSGGCGCGAGGGGSVSPPLDPFTTNPPADPTGTPPDGYADWDSYKDRKCDIAEWIVDNMVTDLVWLNGGAIGVLTGGALAIGIASILSGGTLTIILASAAGIIGLGVGVLQILIDALNNNREALRCSLYDATNAQNSKSDFMGALDNAIDGETADPTIRYALKQFAYLWADSSQINLMYEALTDASPDIPAGPGCGGCAQAAQLIAQDPFGVLPDKPFIYDAGSDTWSVVIDQETTPGIYYWNFNWSVGGGDDCAYAFTIANAQLSAFAVNPAPGPEITWNPCPEAAQEIRDATSASEVEAFMDGMGSIRRWDLRFGVGYTVTVEITASP